MQAFNRSLLLAPELYGNPWFLRDDEYPKLARLFNLHRAYRDVLVKGLVLPEWSYSKNAVSRGAGASGRAALRPRHPLGKAWDWTGPATRSCGMSRAKTL